MSKPAEREESPEIIEIPKKSRPRKIVIITEEILEGDNWYRLKQSTATPEMIEPESWENYEMENCGGFEEKQTENAQIDVFDMEPIQFQYYNVKSHKYFDEPVWPENYLSSSSKGKTKKEDRGMFFTVLKVCIIKIRIKAAVFKNSSLNFSPIKP